MIVEGLVTDRLLFRRLTMEDVEVLMEFFSDAEAMKFLNLAVGDRSVCENWIGRQLSRYINGSGMCAVLEKSTGELLGLCGLLIQEIEENTELEVGYHFIRRFWGKGYATEAARACRDLAFTATSIESLIPSSMLATIGL